MKSQFVIVIGTTTYQTVKIIIFINFTLVQSNIKAILRNVKDNGGQSWRRGIKCDCKIDWLWVRSPLEEMKYLLKFIFPFLRSGVEAKRDVEFCHSTRNVSRIQQKVGNRVY